MSLIELINQRGVTYPHGERGEGYDIQQHPEELAQFVLAMQALGVQTVLELGTGVSGGLARFMAEDLGWTVTHVDINRPSYVSPRATFVQSDTFNALAFLPLQAYDLVIIDASHDYDFVERDRAFYAPLATKAVMFHDIEGLRGAEGSLQHWRELAYADGSLKAGYHEIIVEGEWRIGIGWYEVPAVLMQEAQPVTPPDTPLLLSIVSGTYNRFELLRRMINSARARIRPGISYEFVIVDGGSTDGTLEWLRQQPDVRLIEHGELRGAILAFTEGADSARGQYVIMSNDDIEFLDDGIMAGIAYLEAHPQCGAVAFADDRPQTPYPPGFKVQTMLARKRGQRVSVVYAQVGMYRKWLGDLAGWWGGHDPIMGAPKLIYGADNFLSARIWEMGYTVDAVPACKARDYVAPDELRRINEGIERANPGKYFERYPEGAEVRLTPAYINPQQERLRILLAHVFEPAFKQHWNHKRGLREALARRGLVYEVVINEAHDIVQIARDWQPHLVLTQCMDASCMTPAILAAARGAAPGAVWLNWNGDVWEDKLLAPAMLELLRGYDAQLVVNAAVITPYADAGIPAFYWQIGYEPVDTDNLPDVPAYDVLFQGNCYSSARVELGTALQALRERGLSVGIYGQGWQHQGIDAQGETNYNYPAMWALNTRAGVVISDNQFPHESAFVSNRLINALAAGALVAQQRVKELNEHTGYKADEHYLEFSSVDELSTIVDTALKMSARKRKKITAAARDWTQAHYSFDALVGTLFGKILPALADWGQQ